MPETLPEGTDHIIPGAASTGRGDTGTMTSTAGDPDLTSAAIDTGGSAREQIRTGAPDLRDKAQAKADELRGQASDKALEYAKQGKERASSALGEFARLIGENAEQLDGKLGSQYGDYARRAADAVSSAADTLRDKDVEELLADARTLVRNSPALAIGGAAAAGFFLARILKSGSEALNGAAKAATVEDPPVAAATRKPSKGKSSKSAKPD